MIKEIIIKNFEGHKYFRAKLDLITSFIGATDAGKSSIIRAVEWVATNWYNGPADSFILDENKPAYVGIKTEKGIVSRKKGKGINTYKVNGMTLKAFGTKVPEEVQQFLNMDKLNFQDQFDAPYWFFISPGEVSKKLNQIVDLEIIDTTLSKLTSKIRQGKSEVKVSKQRMGDVETELGQLSFVKPMVKEHNQLFKLETKIKEGRSYFDSLATETKNVQRYILRAKTLSQAVSDGIRVVKIGDQYESKTNQMDSLSNIVNNLEKDITVAKTKIPNIKPLSIIYNEWKKAKLKYNTLSKYITETISEKEKVCQREKELHAKERKLKKMIGKTCPLCGKTVS